jgi:alpha-1,2-mannosyltransferase
MPLAILAPRPISVRLWQATGLLLVWTFTLVLANVLASPQDRVGLKEFGHDFVAFYSAGTLVNEGRSADLYDLGALQARQLRITQDAGLTDFERVAPWWNPPQVAWLFAPLARLPFGTALLVWTWFNGACLVASALILMRLIAAPHAGHRWLVPALLIAAYPTLQFLGHGQNTGLSLLLLSGTAWAFTVHRPILAGALAGLLAYKPQHAALLSATLLLLMGWRVLPGLALTALPQAIIAFGIMPEAAVAFIRQLPLNLRELQFDRAYPWDRHVTTLAFWRVLFQGRSTGVHHAITSICATLSTLAIAAGLAWCWWRSRSGAMTRLRLLAIAMLATPVLMPFYFDYDLLLLAVPAALIARECFTRGDVTRSDRAFAWLGVALMIWTMLNIHVLALTGVNGSVLLIVAVMLQASRARVRSAALVDADFDGMLGYEDLQTRPARQAA